MVGVVAVVVVVGDTLMAPGVADQRTALYLQDQRLFLEAFDCILPD